jgi:type IV secretion system protein VirB4
LIETHGQSAFAAEWLRHRGSAWAVELLPPDPRHQPQQELPL